jgi:hypothetical protein
MRTIFYEHLTFGDPTPAGAVTVEHGVAQIPPELAWINTVQTGAEPR